MSAEKEIVNFWLNKSGYFTMSNLKSGKNQDIGILAVKNTGVKEALHVEISVSLTGALTELNEILEKFNNHAVNDAISGVLKDSFPEITETKKVLIIGSLPKSKKLTIKYTLKKNNIEIFELDSILYNVLKDIDTQYHKNNTLRTLQLVKHVLMANPEHLSQLLDVDANILNQQTRKEFARALVNKEHIIRNFPDADNTKVMDLLKYYIVKDPLKLAEILENDILNNKTRKPFMKALLEQKKFKKIKEEQPKKEAVLSNYFS